MDGNCSLSVMLFSSWYFSLHYSMMHLFMGTMSIQEKEMRKIIDYIAYRLYYIYLRHKDPDPRSAVTYAISLAVFPVICFFCTLILRVFLNVSVRDIWFENSRLSVTIYVAGIGGFVYWWVKKTYTEKYITTTLTSRYQSSKYNKRIKGWILIIICWLCFLSFTIATSIIG